MERERERERRENDDAAHRRPVLGNKDQSALLEI